MTYKQLQQAHEARMWIKEVCIPAAATVVLLASNDDVRRAVANQFGKQYQKAENFTKNLFKRKKSKRSDIIDCEYTIVR